jgi:hypothetical protein
VDSAAKQSDYGKVAWMISPSQSPNGEIPEGFLPMDGDFGQPAPFVALQTIRWRRRRVGNDVVFMVIDAGFIVLGPPFLRPPSHTEQRIGSMVTPLPNFSAPGIWD